jgi:hypothetical protein
MMSSRWTKSCAAQKIAGICDPAADGTHPGEPGPATALKDSKSAIQIFFFAGSIGIPGRF